MLKHILALVLAAILLTGCGQLGTQESVSSDDQVLASAYAEHRSGIQVNGAGTVTRLLPDDNDGGRHQRFVVTLASGQTLLVAHNIDVAPRIDSLRPGDSIEFSGVYEWNDQGGPRHENGAPSGNCLTNEFPWWKLYEHRVSITGRRAE